MEAAASPLPRDETTPPVTNTNLVFIETPLSAQGPIALFLLKNQS
jgi:hypothetical protein